MLIEVVETSADSYAVLQPGLRVLLPHMLFMRPLPPRLCVSWRHCTKCTSCRAGFQDIHSSLLCLFVFNLFLCTSKPSTKVYVGGRYHWHHFCCFLKIKPHHESGHKHHSHHQSFWSQVFRWLLPLWAGRVAVGIAVASCLPSEKDAALGQGGQAVLWSMAEGDASCMCNAGSLSKDWASQSPHRCTSSPAPLSGTIYTSICSDT